MRSKILIVDDERSIRMLLQAKDLPITAFLDKPFELTTLIKVVRETFGAAASM